MSINDDDGVDELFKVGDKVLTTRDCKCMYSTIKKGTVVTITGIGDRGYDIEDDSGNRIIETGFLSVKKIS
jgi:hypothetical protein